MTIKKFQIDESKVSILISIISVGVAIWALLYSMNVEKALGTKNAIDSFDAKWIGGTFPCMDYLLTVPEREKVLAFQGKKHSAMRDQMTTLENCVPKYADEIEQLVEQNGLIQVSAKYAYEAKDTVRKSLNALNIMTKRFSEIDACEAWDTVDSIYKKNDTRTIVEEWRKYGGCGSNCFDAVGSMFDQDIIAELNRACN